MAQRDALDGAVADRRGEPRAGGQPAQVGRGAGGGEGAGGGVPVEAEVGEGRGERAAAAQGGAAELDGGSGGDGFAIRGDDRVIGDVPARAGAPAGTSRKEAAASRPTATTTAATPAASMPGFRLIEWIPSSPSRPLEPPG